jgi:dipeptidase E
MEIKKQIIAIGGGSFTSLGNFSTAVYPIEQYFLDQTGKACPKICFLPTASGEDEQYIVEFFEQFLQFECKPMQLSLFNPKKPNLKEILLDQDAIFVGGGNTKSMMAIWKEWHIDKYLEQAWNQGIVLGGSSAGCICWFEQGLTDSIPNAHTAIEGLGFIKGSNSPHYDAEKARRPAYHSLIENRTMKPGVAIDDNVAVHFINDQIENVVRINPAGNAYYVYQHDGKIIEKKL